MALELTQNHGCGFIMKTEQDLQPMQYQMEFQRLGGLFMI